MSKLIPNNLENPELITPVDSKIENYMRSQISNSDNAVLTQMETLATEQNFPIVGRLVGVFLHSLAKMISARRIFEFGSGYGYSAYWFAQAAGLQGQVICSDASASNCDQAEQFLRQAGLWDNIDFKVGMAQQVFAETDGEFDICYNDVDKGDYPEIWHLAKDRIRSGGLYIADNVLWHGRVAIENPIDIVEGWTEAILEHNQFIFQDPNFDSFINPTRDGVIVARRK